MRQIKCRKCGAIFLSDSKDRTLCKACELETRRSSVYRERTCIDCGEKFKGFPKSKRCPDCQTKVNRERNAVYKRKGSNRKLRSEAVCENCGRTFLISSGLQRYCPVCAETAVRNNISRAKAEQYKKTDPQERRATRQKSRENRKVCVVCGNTFTSHTQTVTCSPECEKEQKRILMAIADVKRGKANPALILSKMPHPNPQSGIRGITWHKGKWQLQIKGKYIGIYNTIDEAAAVKKSMEEKQHED